MPTTTTLAQYREDVRAERTRLAAQGDYDAIGVPDPLLPLVSLPWEWDRPGAPHHAVTTTGLRGAGTGLVMATLECACGHLSSTKASALADAEATVWTAFLKHLPATRTLVTPDGQAVVAVLVPADTVRPGDRLALGGVYLVTVTHTDRAVVRYPESVVLAHGLGLRRPPRNELVWVARATP